MMENKHPIDRVYNQRFESYEPNFDQQEVWHDLEAKLEDKGRDRTWPLFSLLALALLVSLLFRGDSLLELKNSSLSLAEDSMSKKVDQSTPILTRAEFNWVLPASQNSEHDDLFNVKLDNLEANITILKAIEKPTSHQKGDAIMDFQPKAKKLFALNESSEPVAIFASKQKEFRRVLPLANRLHSLPVKSFSDSQRHLPKRKRDWSRDCAVEQSPSFYLNPYVAGQYTFQMLRPLFDQENYAAQWEEYDDVLPGYAAGLLLGYEHPSGLNLEAGLEWQQVFERLLFYQLVTETIKVYSDSAYYWEDENGNIEYFGDTVTTERTYERKVQSLKRHRIWSIPFGLGYTFGKGKWQLGLQVGAVFHLDHQFKGRVFTPGGSFDYLDPVADKGRIYDSKLGLSWYASIRFYFLPSQRMECYVAPGFRYNSNSWTTSDSGLELLNHFAELKLGARIFF